jgi:hypothetical protein
MFDTLVNIRIVVFLYIMRNQRANFPSKALNDFCSVVPDWIQCFQELCHIKTF